MSKRLNEKFAMPMIYISHDMAEIEYLADHLVMMERHNHRDRAAAYLAE